MRPALDEEGLEAIAESRGGVVDGDLGQDERHIQVVLVAVGAGGHRVAEDALARSALA